MVYSGRTAPFRLYGTDRCTFSRTHVQPGVSLATGTAKRIRAVSELGGDLAADFVKTVTILHHALHLGNCTVQCGKAVTHLGDIGVVFLGNFPRNHATTEALCAVKGQIHGGIVVVRCAGEQGADEHHD